MPREYKAKLDGAGNVMISRQKDDPRKTKWYSISPRDLYAALKAWETMGVFDKRILPGHITMLYFSGDDIKVLEKFVDDGPKKTAD